MDAKQLARIIERQRELARERQRRRRADWKSTGESLIRTSYSVHVERNWH